MNRRLLPFIIGLLLLPPGCGGNADPTGTGSVATLAVTTTSLLDGLENVEYIQTLAATGGEGSYSWALAAGSGPVPSGLSLATSGRITGTPAEVGSSDFTVEVASGDGQTSQRVLSITVSKRFLGSEFTVEVESDIVYATGAVRSPADGEIDLLLDVYRPADANLPPLRPGFILIHGGGFTGGTKTNATMVALGNAYAERGYVAASINYRLVGDDPPTEGLTSNPSDPVSVAAAAARVDAARAVEWMRANAATTAGGAPQETFSGTRAVRQARAGAWPWCRRAPRGTYRRCTTSFRPRVATRRSQALCVRTPRAEPDAICGVVCLSNCVATQAFANPQILSSCVSGHSARPDDQSSHTPRATDRAGVTTHGQLPGHNVHERV